MIQLKIKEDNNLAKYISLIRKYNNKLSIADIKNRIKNQNYVIEHELISGYDICDDIANIDRNRLFRELISNLLLQGAIIELFENNRLISIEYLDNRLNSIVEIEQETLSDIDNQTPSFAISLYKEYRGVWNRNGFNETDA